MFHQRCDREIFSHISKIDKQHLNDVYHVSEFVSTIQENMLRIESKWNADPTYMSKQNKIDETIRSTLIDWMIQIHYNFKLLSETLHLTVNIIDRYMGKHQI